MKILNLKSIINLLDLYHEKTVAVRAGDMIKLIALKNKYPKIHRLTEARLRKIFLYHNLKSSALQREQVISINQS